MEDFNPDKLKFVASKENVSTVGPVDEEDKVIDQAAMDALSNWLLDGGSQFPKLALRSYEVDDGDDSVRGVVSTGEIADDETVVQIPLKFLFTVEDGKATDVGRAILAHNLSFDAPKHIFLLLFLLIDGENPSSFFRPYFDILPKTLSNIPVFWKDDQMKWLEGSHLVAQVNERRAAIERDYNAICAISPDFSRFSLNKFGWARMIVCSRNFGMIINGVRTSAMVPFADMLNHHRPRETRWGFDHSLQSFTITSTMALSVGHPVYDSYGKKCNHRFLLNYGFALENNLEPDGSCPNEVRVSLDITTSDPLYTTKKHLLGGSGDTSTALETRVSAAYTDKNPLDAFAFLRFVVANEKDLQNIQLRGGGYGYDPLKYCRQPLNSENELRVLELWKDIASEQLRGYPRSSDQDLDDLKSDRLAPFSNERHAVIMVLGEKTVFQHYQSLYGHAKPILTLPASEMSKFVLDKEGISDSVYEYLSRVCIPLVQRAARNAVITNAVF